MMFLLKYNKENNIVTHEYYAESEEDLQNWHNPIPVGSIVTILTDTGLKVKMRHSDGTWKEV